MDQHAPKCIWIARIQEEKGARQSEICSALIFHPRHYWFHEALLSFHNLPLHRHYLNIFGFDYNYECTIDKKICIKATYIPKMFCLIYRNSIDQASVPFLAGWFNGSSKRWMQHTCLHTYIHRHGLSHMHHKIDLKHQPIGAFVVFGVYIWFTSENKCFCRS